MAYTNGQADKMNFAIFTILLFVGCTVNAIYVNPNEPEKILLIKCIVLNQKSIHLRELYGDIPFSLMSTFNPGNKVRSAILNDQVLRLNNPAIQGFEKHCCGGQYVQRVFHSTQHTSLFVQSTITDTPTALAQTIVNNINTVMIMPSLYVIAGEMGMGKTVAMLKIHYEITQTKSPIWPVQIHLKSIRNDHPLAVASIYDIIQLTSTTEHSELFFNLLSFNPKKIVILFDGVDHCEPAEIANIFSIIKNIVERGATVVVSDRTVTTSRYASLGARIFEIPEMPVSEIKQFLKNIWTKELDTDNPNEKLSTSQNQRFNDYIETFTEILSQAPLPRTPTTLIRLAELFTKEKDLSIFRKHPSYNYRAGCVDYVLSNTPSSKLRAILENVPLNKMKLFDYLHRPEAFRSRNYVKNKIAQQFYGPHAVRQIFNTMPEIDNTRFEIDLQLANNHLELHGPQKFRAVHINPPLSIKFINSEYQNYYAAKYIAKKLDIINYPRLLFREIFKNPDSNDLLESVYSAIQDLYMHETIVNNLIKLLLYRGGIDPQIFHNIILYGPDELCYIIMKKLNELAPINFQQLFIESSIFYVQTERRFGMLPSNLYGLDYNLSKIMLRLRVTFTQYRAELLFKRNMIKSLGVLDHGSASAIYLDHHSFILTFETIITQPLPNLELFDLLIKWMPKTYFISQSRLDDFLYKAIDNIGDGCQDIANALVQFGADPTFINNEGHGLRQAAEKWNSKELLRYITDELRVPAVVTVALIDNYQSAGTSNTFPVISISTDEENSLSPKIPDDDSLQLFGIRKFDNNAPSNIEKCFKQIRRERRFVNSPINCQISWNDVDQFNDAVNRRSLNSILMNSDKFLNLLATMEYSNNIKAQQLLQLGKYLEYNHGNAKFITGDFTMLTQDILHHGGWTNYHQNKRLDSIIGNLFHPLRDVKSSRVRFSLPSRTIILWGAASLPMIRGFYSTIITCLQQYNDTNNNCLYASGVLAASAALGPASYPAIRLTPWLINKFSNTALDIIPSITPNLIHNNIKLMRYFGLKYGAKSMVVGLGAAGIGLDLYNIIELSQMIDQCSREKNNCLNKNKIDYIISLSFSCLSIVAEAGILIHGMLIATSIAFVPGLIIGLSLLLLQTFATGINDVIYYDNTYHTTISENFRIFFHKIALLDPPADIQALQQRTDWLNILQKRAFNLLEDSQGHIAAYAMGIGSFQTGQVQATTSTINMNHASLRNTQNLSRIVLNSINNLTTLCFPQRDTQAIYYDTPGVIKNDAIYKCANAIVIAQQQRWYNKIYKKSYIIYDLDLIDSGTIVGSHQLNNLFLINNGRSDLNIIGGSNLTTNTFIIRNETFRGTLFVYEQTNKNNLDLSSVNSSILHFIWHRKSQSGRVQFGKVIDDAFFISAYEWSPNLHVIGRSAKPEIFQCDYIKYNDKDNHTMTVDGAGGKSSTEMDQIIDCRTSILYPFTRIEDNNKNINNLYITYVWLGSKILSSNKIDGYATIRPQASTFAVIFGKYPLFASIYAVNYSPSDKSLVWKLAYMDSSLLILDIKPYSLTANSTSISENNKIPTVTLGDQ